MNLSDIIKIAAIACSCRNRARALLSDNELLDDETFDALIAYTDNVLDTIDLLSEVLQNHDDNLNTHDCLILMQQIKENIDKSAEIEQFLSQYVSLTVH